MYSVHIDRVTNYDDYCWCVSIEAPNGDEFRHFTVTLWGARRIAKRVINRHKKKGFFVKKKVTTFKYTVE